jgi:hypothetical protein
MPDTRKHRGANPEDKKLFGDDQLQNLSFALADLSLLLTKGYAEKSSLKLVGDRFNLTERQRLAVMRNSCSDEQLRSRGEKMLKIEDSSGGEITLDGYNILITIESAMSGACIFKGRDGTFKDLASVHGTYRKVNETIPAITLIGRFLEEKGLKDCLWLLDSPVSNSGRLKKIIENIASQNQWNWQVQLVLNPDPVLIQSDRIIASSDGVVLDGCKKWINLSRSIIENKFSDAWLIDLCSDS